MTSELVGRFRKKPIVVEAVRFTTDRLSLEEAPEWFAVALVMSEGQVGRIRRRGDTLSIKTLEGDMIASPGDWIIRGVEGELYPCKPSVFNATYEPVEALTRSSAAEEMKEDAERYRWLRAGNYNRIDDGLPYPAVHTQNSWGKWSDQPVWRKQLDAAIDAARGKPEKAAALPAPPDERRQALEEAAKVCERPKPECCGSFVSDENAYGEVCCGRYEPGEYMDGVECAAAIRALKDTPAAALAKARPSPEEANNG